MGPITPHSIPMVPELKKVEQSLSNFTDIIIIQK